MSDVNMGKIKALYADMVSIEKNAAAIENRIIGHLANLERTACQHSQPVARSQGQSPATTLKTLLMVASTAFGTGLALTTDAGFRVSWIAGIPIGMAITWLVFHCVEKRGRGALEAGYNRASEVKRLWTEIEFKEAAAAALPKLSDRTLEACWRVLIHEDAVESAAKANKLLPVAVRRALTQFEKNRPGTRS